MNVFGIAARTNFHHRARKSAVVADQSLALFVKRERDAAIFALHGGSATAAQREPGISAAVDKDQGLRAGGEAIGHRRAKLRGKWRRAMSGAEIFAHVHDGDLRQRAAADRVRRE